MLCGEGPGVLSWLATAELGLHLQWVQQEHSARDRGPAIGTGDRGEGAH